MLFVQIAPCGPLKWPAAHSCFGQQSKNTRDEGDAKTSAGNDF